MGSAFYHFTSAPIGVFMTALVKPLHALLWRSQEERVDGDVAALTIACFWRLSGEEKDLGRFWGGEYDGELIWSGVLSYLHGTHQINISPAVSATQCCLCSPDGTCVGIPSTTVSGCVGWTGVLRVCWAFPLLVNMTAACHTHKQKAKHEHIMILYFKQGMRSFLPALNCKLSCLP